MDSEFGENVASVTGCRLRSNSELVRDCFTGEAANEEAYDLHFAASEVERVHRMGKHLSCSLSGLAPWLELGALI